MITSKKYLIGVPSDFAKQLSQRSKGLFGRNLGSRLFGDHIDIKAVLDQMPVCPEKFTDEPLDPIADNCIADSSGNRDAQPRVVELIFAERRHKKPVCHTVAVPGEMDKLSSLQQFVLFL